MATRMSSAEGRRQRFTSRILPPYMRRSPKVAEVLPILYLRGLSTGDFRPALTVLGLKLAASHSPAPFSHPPLHLAGETQCRRSAISW
jgi:putative transposase